MSDESPAPSPAKSDRRRKLLIRVGIAAGAVLLLFVLVVFVLPTPLARYVIDSQLEKFGIEHDGLDTVDVDLWNSRVHAGPVHFHSGAAEQGQIGETGFDYSFGAIFKGRAFIQTFYLRGVDLFIRRLESGAIEINGVNLQELSAADGEEPEEPAEEEEKDGFGFGVESFEFSDSKLVFEDLTGGSLAIDLEKLTLDRLLTWTPEEPTAFAMKGNLNEIGLSLEGTLVPLGDPLRVTLHTQFSGVTLEKVSRFIGPTGLAREEGSVDTDVHYDYAIYEDGKIEGSVAGRYKLTGLSIATETGEEATLADGSVEVNLEQQLLPDGNASAKGDLRLEAAPLTFSTSQGDGAQVAELLLTFDDLSFVKGVEERRLLNERVAEPAESATPQRAQSLIELMIGWARELGLNALRHHLEIQGTPSLTIKDALLKSAPRGPAPGQETRLGELSVTLGQVTTEAFDAGVSFSAGLQLAIQGLESAADSGEESNLESFQVESREIGLRATREATELTFDAATTLQSLTVADGKGFRFGLGALTLASKQFHISQAGEEGTAEGPLALTLEGIDASLPATLGEMTLQGERLALTLSPLKLQESGGRTSASLTGLLESGSFSLDGSGGTALAVKLGWLRSDLQGFSAAPLDATARLGGGLTTSFSDFSLEIGGGSNGLSLRLAKLENSIAGLEASGLAEGDPTLSLSTTTTLSGLEAELPASGEQRASARLESLDLPLSSVTYAGGALAAEGDLTLGTLSAQSLGEPAQSLQLAGITVSGIKGGSEGGMEIASIAMGQLNTALALPSPGGGSDAPEGSGPATESSIGGGATEGGSPPVPPDPPLRLGEFTLAPGSRIEITDPGVEPPLKAELVIEELRLGPIDTGASETRSDIAFSASLNETTKAVVTGWASPLKSAPDFDLKADVDQLVLPLLSPYAAKAVGVDIESGELTSQASASATGGALEGRIDLSIRDLFVAPISEEEAERLKANVGLPVGFAVGILKDQNGVIELGFPLSGTVEEPVLDYSEAINKAIAGAMASLFPVTWFGADGNSFEMQPATFAPGTSELTEEGKAVADEMGKLFASKPGISIRACGRSARADLLAMRGAPPEPAAPPPPEGEAEEESAEQKSDAGGEQAAAQPPAAELPDPSEAEVESLLALATERGLAVRQYLESTHSIDPARLSECRTGYSIKDGKPPRAEFQF